MYVLVNIINWKHLLPPTPKISQDCETALASQLWSENIHLVSRGVTQSVMGSAMEPAMEADMRSVMGSFMGSVIWLVKSKKVNLCVKILKHLVIFKNRQRRLGDGDGDAPFYWRGPRLNLIAPRSVLPFWNRLGERIKKSVVMESFHRASLEKFFSNGVIFTHPRIFRRFLADISETVPLR